MVISDQTHLINELTQGMKLAKQLRAQPGTEFSSQTNEILVQQIISSYEKALMILGCGSPQPHKLTPVASSLSPSSPSSYIGTPKNIDEKARTTDDKECSLKRKSASTWTQRVKIIPENGLNDGYSWRKYGQKDILGAKYPRSYYRCTYRNAQDCWATRQVQRSEDDATVFEITYRGKHTCSVVEPSKKQEPKQKHQQDYDIISSFVDELADVRNNCLESENPILYGDFCPSGSNYSLQQMQYLDGGIADVVLGATSHMMMQN